MKAEQLEEKFEQVEIEEIIGCFEEFVQDSADKAYSKAGKMSLRMRKYVLGELTDFSEHVDFYKSRNNFRFATRKVLEELDSQNHSIGSYYLTIKRVIKRIGLH